MLAVLKARIFLSAVRWESYVAWDRFTASVHDKQGPVTQIKHEPSDSNLTRFRSESHDGTEAGIGKVQ
jgi:hypothetical protein